MVVVLEFRSSNLLVRATQLIRRIHGKRIVVQALRVVRFLKALVLLSSLAALDVG